MPRQRRAVIPNCPHHITQRGNNRRSIFFSDGDREVYLSLLKEYALEYGVEILRYCLMTNHVHVIAIPTASSGLAKAFGRTHNDYARWLNIRHRESGHVWQNRFFSCPIESHYLWAVLAYVERNPVRAGLVSRRRKSGVGWQRRRNPAGRSVKIRSWRLVNNNSGYRCAN
jgi:putative transposase